MRELSLKELIKYKILPFNLYNEKGQVIMYSAELLTPGKLLELKDMRIFLYDENYKHKPRQTEENPLVKRRLAEKKRRIEKLRENRQQLQRPIIKEVFEMSPSMESSTSKVFDDLDISNYIGTINKHSIIPDDTQLKLKQFYSDLTIALSQEDFKQALEKYIELRDKIVQDILAKSGNVKFLSEVKLVGEYQKCHSLNVGILAGLVGMKLECDLPKIKDLVLSGLLHDIGITKLNPKIAYKKNLTNSEKKEYIAHTFEGYKIIKDGFDLKESIALPALEHHEYSDGSGYPKGLSIENISFESQIITVCNFYDNLTFNRTSFNIENSRDAVKALLEMGSRKFSPTVLYTLANKFIFNDTLNFANMVN